jgi:hypothetical protein
MVVPFRSVLAIEFFLVPCVVFGKNSPRYFAGL